MKYFRLCFKDGTFTIVKGETALDVVKKHDLASKKHLHTQVTQLEGEQEIYRKKQ